MAVSGNDLKVERIRARLKLIEVANRMGLSRQSVSTLERLDQVNPERVEQYRTALAMVPDIIETSRVPA